MEEINKHTEQRLKLLNEEFKIREIEILIEDTLEKLKLVDLDIDKISYVRKLFSRRLFNEHTDEELYLYKSLWKLRNCIFEF